MALKIEGLAILSKGEYDITINGIPLHKIVNERLDTPKYKDFYARVSINIELLETGLTVNGEPWKE